MILYSFDDIRWPKLWKTAISLPQSPWWRAYFQTVQRRKWTARNLCHNSHQKHQLPAQSLNNILYYGNLSPNIMTNFDLNRESRTKPRFSQQIRGTTWKIFSCASVPNHICLNARRMWRTRCFQIRICSAGRTCDLGTEWDLEQSNPWGFVDFRI